MLGLAIPTQKLLTEKRDGEAWRHARLSEVQDSGWRD